MTRWKPDARGRLVEAAMALYRERGFDHTTVAEIAERAGLTERTFFRYFIDKREVLFSGSAMLQDLLVEKVLGAPPMMAPIDVVAAALEATAPMFEERREHAGKRQKLIEAHAELMERELIKFASLASAIEQALRQRGVAAPTATLAAEVGIAIFKAAFERWLDDGKKRDLAHHVRASLSELKTAASGVVAQDPRRRDADGATRRQAAGSDGDRDQRRRDDHKRHRIRRRDAK